MIKYTLTPLILFFCSQLVSAQTVTNWYEGKGSALALTFDDWSPGQEKIAAPTLIKEKIEGTFFVTTTNVNSTVSYSQMKQLLNNGCEIGNHTKTHPQLTSISNNQGKLTTEIVTTKDVLEKNVSGLNVTIFCYPQGLGPGNKNVENMVKKDHIAARGIFAPRSRKWSYAINDYYNLPTIAINKNMTLSLYKKHLETVQTDGGLMTLMYHSIYNDKVNDTWYDAIPESDFLAQLEEVKKVDKKVWVTTVDKAIRYHKEKNCATIFQVLNSSTQRVFTLTDTLSNNTLYNHPLTIELGLEEGEKYIGAEQDGVVLTLREEGNKLYFNAIPDAGNIILKKEASTGIIEDIQTKGLGVNVYPNPVENTTVIQVGIKTPTNISVVLLDIRGVSVKTLLNTYQTERIKNHSISFEGIKPETYVIKVITDYGEGVYRILKK